MSHKIALILGTNSNLGLGIAYRLLETVDPTSRLTLIVTSRTLPRARETIDKIKEHNAQNVKRSGILEFDYVLVDFSNMVSILCASYDLKKQYTQIDYVFCNAAHGVYKGIDWIGATKAIIKRPIDAVTNPDYKIQRVGVKSGDGLGVMFQANVFGPYYFINLISTLLANSKDGRVVWISSLMSAPKFLSFGDLQLLKTDEPYEGSKRLLNLLHLATFESFRKRGITTYITHPGIFVSANWVASLNVLANWGMLMLFYLARALGSPWHNISGENASTAPIFAALEADPVSDSQALFYGSSTSVNGTTSVKTEEIDGTGAEDVRAYINALSKEWDEKLKDQIVETRVAHLKP
ncbi:unnamed protein product [Kuraishia capsulata CBS 1993]|uniref:3beta-hydroxysteroid 3-dehydrogenase n=1 Tax=Kuraishia capsulata CBS 1993 TaxID=1382522 RepID=W6MM54_9ASCO|nr:uncharacterized protein KUCA_T00003574001 [Kuraishia capsulata CBS 1993]CDK27596.1 unnamed protein product [Kuraishia capsulata CBS 1993]